MNQETTTTTRWQVSGFAAVVLLLAIVAAPGATDAGQQSEPEIFRGILIAMGTMATGANTSLNMHITDWTSPSQRQVLLNALMGGSDEESLFNVLRRQPEKGFLQVRNTPGTIRLKYAWQTMAEDGTRTIILIADNLLPIMVSAGTQRLKEQEYTIVTLNVDEDGKGTGSMAASASISWDAEAERIKIGIESTEPMRITSITKVQ